MAQSSPKPVVCIVGQSANERTAVMMTEAQREALLDRRIMRRLSTDSAYRNAENAEEQTAREEEITAREEARLENESINASFESAWHVFYDAENCYLVLAASESEAAEQAEREHGTGWQYIERISQADLADLRASGVSPLLVPSSTAPTA